jgi:hypothetical protein
MLYLTIVEAKVTMQQRATFLLFLRAKKPKKTLSEFLINVKCMTTLNSITFNPQQCGGKPCVRGMRIRVTVSNTPSKE